MNETTFFLEDIYDERLGRNELINILKLFLREGDILLFEYKYWLLDTTESAFIHENTVYESTQSVFPVETKPRLTTVKWFEITSEKWLDWALKKEMLFECLIHSKQGSLVDYSYALNVQENIDSYSLVIYEKNKREFESLILPQILRQYSSILTWGRE